MSSATRGLPARTIHLPAGCVIEDAEIVIVLTLLNRAKEAGDAELVLMYSNGSLSKKLLSIGSLGSETRLVGGVRIKTEF